ncbi:MAG: hypothetical protein FWH57_09680 [Oscillospiraceae bacterium]|nr:hypothetical protein [Oscillospiraceae bacterium]
MKHRKILKAVITVILTLAVALSSISAMAITVTPDASYRIYLVGNAHIDTSWTWPFQHTAEVVIRDTWNRQITALMSADGVAQGWTFTMSAATHYLWLKEYYDVDTNTNATYQNFWNNTRALIEEGRWGLAGGQFVEPDLNLTGGEAYARQGLYAQHIFLDFFGKMSSVAYVPDVFGFSGQFPQFIRKTGQQSFIATKLNWRSDPGNGAFDPGPWAETSGGQASNGRESDLYWWEGIDGSDVLSYNCVSDYTSSYAVSTFTGATNTVFNRIRRSGTLTYNDVEYDYDWDSGIKYAVGMYGSGDHGGGPNSGTGNGTHGFAYANNANATGRSSAISSTIGRYFDDVRLPSAQANDGWGLSHVYRHKGENYLAYHRGTYTSWSRVKKYNKQNEILAEVAEKAATLGFWANALDNNGSDKVYQSWYRICTNQMHDVLPGSASPPQYIQTFMHQELVRNLMANLENNSLLALSHRANTSVDEGVPVFVYNPSSWTRDGETTTSIKLDKYYPYIKAFDGATELPITVIENEADANGAAKISFIAKGVPSLGYKVFKIVGSDSPSGYVTDLALTTTADLYTIENENIRFTISRSTGNIPSLQLKKFGNREMINQNASIQGNSLQVKVDTGGGSYPAWDMTNAEFGGVAQKFGNVNDADEVSIVENTPEKITIKVVQTWFDSASPTSTAIRYISLLAGSDRIDVRFELDWRMTQRNLKLAFPTNVDAKAVSAEIAYGAMDAGAELARMAQADLALNGNLGGPGALGRSTLRDTRWNSARFEQSANKWFDVSDDTTFAATPSGYGLSIMNDAKYGYDVLRMTGTRTAGCGLDENIPASDTYVRQQLTVVRSPQSASETQETSRYLPRNTTIDIGYQEFNYSIYPHAGNWKTANTSSKAHEVNYPMPSFQTVASLGDGILGKENSFLTTDKTNVKIGAVKNQHDNQQDKNTLIVRVWESNGLDTQNVKLTMPSNVISVKEVNMLEHDYNATYTGVRYDGVPYSYTAQDNRDIGIGGEKALVARDFTGKFSGKDISFDIDHYEILTLQVEIAPYAGAQLQLKQQVVDLDGLFNLKGTTTDAARTASSIDGAGNSIPEKLWGEAKAKRVDYQGIKFDLASESAENLISASGQTVPVNGAGFSRIFLLGNSAGTGAKSGSFVVNYSDGTSTAKDIAFADWKSNLTGWDLANQVNTDTYVFDSVAQVFTHWHSGTRDENTLDNYLFAYYIDVDDAKTISSIKLPDAPGIKIAAITAIGTPIAGFGSTNASAYEFKSIPPVASADELFWNLSSLDFYVGSKVGSLVSTGATDRQNIHLEGEVSPVGTLALTYFTALVDAGAGGNANEGPANIITTATNTKFCGGVGADNAWFIVDAGQNRRTRGYIISGANDDQSYRDRVLDGWIVQGGDSGTGPWTTIAETIGMGEGWTSNQQTRMFLFDWSAPGLPANGYRYYRLQVISQGQAGVTPSGTMQFSRFALTDNDSTPMTNGSLKAWVEESVDKKANDITIDTVTGKDVLTFVGEVAKVGTTPVAARTYTSIRTNLSIPVYADTKISYMVNPKNSASAYVAFDITFSDNTRLRDLATAVDQYGVRMNPQYQGAGGKIIPGKWNFVECELGKFAEGKTISRIIIGYDNPTADPAAPIECSFDYIWIHRSMASIDIGKFIDMRVTNGTLAGEDVKAYVVLYNAKGQMVNSWISDIISMGAGSTVTINPSDVVFGLEAVGPGSYAKVFIWTKDEFIPLTNEIYFTL